MTASAVSNPLSSSCMLVHLKVSAWSGLRQEKRIATDAARTHSAIADQLRGSKYLVPKESIDPITKAAGALRLAHYRVTLPWLDDGVRVLSTAAYWTYLRETQTLIDAFNEAADKFASDYPRLRSQAHSKLGSLYDATQYPTDIRSRFAAGATFLPFPDAADFRLSGMNGEMDKLRAKLTTIPDTITKLAAEDIAERITSTVGRIVERMKAYTGGKDGSFRDSLIENVRELAEVLPMLNIGNDPRITAIGNDLRSLATVDPADLRESSKLRAATAESAEDILKKLSEVI